MTSHSTAVVAGVAQHDGAPGWTILIELMLMREIRVINC